MINNAKRPVIYAGQGIISGNAVNELRQLASAGNIPVTTTLLGMGAFDELDSRSLHMLGMHGSVYANYAIQDADVIIALGARFDDRITGKPSTFAPKAVKAAADGTGGIIHFEVCLHLYLFYVLITIMIHSFLPYYFLSSIISFFPKGFSKECK